MRGRIIKFERDTFSSYVLHQGIPGHQQHNYDYSSRYHGGNGTYVSGIESVPEINMLLCMYTEDGNKTISIDVRNEIMRDNPKWVRISQQRFNQICEKAGEKINFELDYDGDPVFEHGEFTIGD